MSKYVSFKEFYYRYNNTKKLLNPSFIVTCTYLNKAKLVKILILKIVNKNKMHSVSAKYKSVGQKILQKYLFQLYVKRKQINFKTKTKNPYTTT